jgi:hypothetical protein
MVDKDDDWVGLTSWKHSFFPCHGEYSLNIYLINLPRRDLNYNQLVKVAGLGSGGRGRGKKFHTCVLGFLRPGSITWAGYFYFLFSVYFTVFIFLSIFKLKKLN